MSPLNSNVVNDESLYHWMLVPVAVMAGVGLPRQIEVSPEVIGAVGIPLIVSTAESAGLWQLLMDVSV